VTNKHCARNDFYVRINIRGGAIVIPFDSPAWILHPDPTVDLAMLEFNDPIDSECAPFSAGSIPSSPSYRYGPGDLTYTVGLFRAHGGRARNIPIVHTGNIAAFSEDERIEVSDWESGRETGTKLIEAYVVQCSASPGSSGSPVFVRSTAKAVDLGHTHDKRGKAIEDRFGFTRDAVQAYGPLQLLGVWRGSWELPQSDFVRGAQIRYPAGYGVVVPGGKIEDILELPVVQARRDEESEKIKAAVKSRIESNH
jgi:hypothetical protein